MITLRPLNSSHIDRIKAIERSAYPLHMQSMQDCEDLEDVLDYMECTCRKCQAWLLTDSSGPRFSWYCLVCQKRRKAEVVDLAKLPGSSARVDWPGIVDELRGLGVRTLKLDAREETSYPYIKRTAQLMGCTIRKEKQWRWGHDILVEMTILI